MSALAALALLAAASPPAADVPPAFAGIAGLRFRYHTMAGATAAELKDALEAQADHPLGGGSSYGSTRWAIRWHWKGQGPGRACRVRTVAMMFDAEVVLPRLADPSALDSEARALWQRFATAIAAHESHHARIAARHVAAVRRAILASRCDDADSVGRAAVARVTRLQADYDRATRNGATEGAHFP